jgi:Flp pilus assembly protein TadD
MSLLMKALEKAAKDRGETRVEQTPAATATAGASTAPKVPAATNPAPRELSLEPMAAEAPAATRVEPASRPAIPSRTAPVAAPPTPPRESATASREHAQSQAAAMMQATATSSSTDGSGIAAYLRTHPLIVLGALAGLFAIGFGVYVYIQIFHPGLLLGRPPVVAPKTPPPSPITQAPTPPAPAAGAAAPGAAAAATAPTEPLPSAPLLKEAAEETAAKAEAAPRTKPQATLPTPPSTREETGRGSGIVVSPGNPEPVLNPLLNDAYAALQSNQLESAQSLYQRTLAADPKNTDALLGLAAIAVRQGNSEEAIRLYLQILELEPRHALAQSGLIALLGRADPAAAETRLKQLIAREPSAFLFFTLGNLYADQSQWASAQLAYFQAHHLDAANPDYAYNLAVSLEHVSQPKLALDFYRRAVQLAAAKGRSNFNPAQAQDRIGKLARQVE